MLRHKGTVTIETIRLILRKFEISDAEDMFYNWASDAEALKFLPWGPHENINVTRRKINSFIDRYEYKNYYNWAISLKPNNEVIGSISVEIQNDTDKTCEVGYCLSREHWNRGIMTEALRAVMHYLFYEIGYDKVTAKYDVLNVASGKVMMKAGMRFEKILYQVSRRKDGSFYDCAVYSRHRLDV